MNLPLVSAIVPCRNEERFISECMRSILDNGYPRDRLEVIVVDGMSTDATWKQVEAIAIDHSNVQLLTNERQITSTGLNLAIAVARGEYLLWMSAHATYAAGFIQQCVEAALLHGADNTGGSITTVARDDTALAPYIVAALTDRFGVGNSPFRVKASEPRWVDTVFGGCYRRDVFERVGTFNEALVRGQDMEFNLRLQRAGLRTLVVPSIRCVYHARTRFAEFLRHNWINGVWAVLPRLYVATGFVARRHLVPLAFAASVIVAVVMALAVPHAWWLLVVIAVCYGIAAESAAIRIARARRSWSCLLVMPPVFLALHLSYGLGSVWGVVLLGAGLLKRQFGRFVAVT